LTSFAEVADAHSRDATIVRNRDAVYVRENIVITVNMGNASNITKEIEKDGCVVVLLKGNNANLSG